MYLASVEDKAVVCCLMANHAMSDENMKNAYPKMLQQSVLSDAQSASVKAQLDGKRMEAGGPMGCCERLIVFQCVVEGAKKIVKNSLCCQKMSMGRASIKLTQSHSCISNIWPCAKCEIQK